MSAPIKPFENDCLGKNVVDIGKVRVSKGMTHRHKNSCPHLNQLYDQQERRVYCADCDSDIEAFDAFISIVGYHEEAEKSLQRRAAEVKEAENNILISKASKAIDYAWRRKNMVPCCPHCSKGIHPEDVVSGLSMVSKKFAEKLRKKP